MKFTSLLAAFALLGNVSAEDSERAQAFVSLDGLQAGRGNLEVGDMTDVTVTV